jgi:serine/threonine protein phosphatase PrpC
MQCPHCGTVNRPAAQFCKGCGASLVVTPPAASPPAPTPGGPPLPVKESKAASPGPPTAEAIAEEVAPPKPIEPPGEDVQAPVQEAAPTPPVTLQPPSSEPAIEQQPIPSITGTVPEATPVPGPEAEPEPGAPPAEPQPAVTPALPPLAPGALIAGRYQVLSVETEDAGNVYLVVNLAVCGQCGQPVNVEEDRFCGECGADLDTVRHTLRLRETLASAEAAPTDTLVEGERWYTEIVAEAPEKVAAPQPPTFPHGVSLLVGQRSDVGVQRAGRPDEDSVFALTMSAIHDSLARPTLGLYIVADGMGGHEAGDLASRLAVDTIRQHLLDRIILPALAGDVPLPETIQMAIDEAVKAANQAVYDMAQQRRNDMGTTVTLALVMDETAYVANVGDSRTYTWGPDGLQQITLDHSLVASLIAAGMEEPDAVYTHPRRNEIYRSLGAKPSVEVDQFTHTLIPDGALVLCCDGLWEMIRSEGIADVLMAGGDPQAMCDEMIRLANQAGGEDNISVIVVRALTVGRLEG